MDKVYSLNLEDPRVQRRIRTAVDFAVSWLTPNRARFLSRDVIDQHLGRSNKPIGKYLRNTLLVTQDDWYNAETGVCKRYSLRTAGIQELTGEAYTPRVTKTRAKRHVLSRFPEIATGAFEYNESDNRLYHPAQNIPSDLRAQLFLDHGYTWNYDIQCAMSTLVVQYARRLGMTRPTPYLDEYIQDRRTCRQRLAREVGCSVQQIKTVLTARFSGARLGREGSIASELNQLQLHRLKRSAWFMGYTKDIKKCWDVIKQQRFGVARLSARDKQSTYRYLERVVMRSIERYLRDDMNVYFLEHDGWRCRDRIDVENLCGVVQRASGYLIQIDEQQVVQDEL